MGLDGVAWIAFRTRNRTTRIAPRPTRAPRPHPQPVQPPPIQPPPIIPTPQKLIMRAPGTTRRMTSARMIHTPGSLRSMVVDIAGSHGRAVFEPAVPTGSSSGRRETLEGSDDPL